jgi:hypothetical protein
MADERPAEQRDPATWTGLVPVRLETRDGRYVVTLKMPPFVVWPEAVQWGQRTFFLHDQGGDFGIPVYREGLLWWAPPGTEAIEGAAAKGEEPEHA